MSLNAPIALLRRELAGRCPDVIRVAGALLVDARLDFTLGSPPHQLLTLLIEPAVGLPYFAQCDLGTDAGNHAAAEALLPHMRKGAAVSVACSSLELRTDHGRTCLRLVKPHAVVLFNEPIQQPIHAAAVPQEA